MQRKILLSFLIGLMMIATIIPMMPNVKADVIYSLTLRPTGDNGYINNFIPSEGTDHYAMVNEVVNDYGATYLVDTSPVVAGDGESFNVPDHTTQTGPITNITIHACARTDFVSDPSGQKMQFMALNGSSYGYFDIGDPYLGEVAFSTTNWTNYTWVFTSVFGQPITWTDVDNMILYFRTTAVMGIESYYVTQIYADIFYTAPPCFRYINVTLTPGGTANIVVNPTFWNPSASIGGNASSATDAFTLDNNGTIQVDVTVNASNTSAWTLGTSPGYNQLQLQWGKQIDYVYAAGESGNAVYKYDASDLTKTAESSFKMLNSNALVADADYVYAGGMDYGSGNHTVSQYWKSNMTEKAVTADCGDQISAVSQDTIYIYAGVTNKVYQYWKSNMTKTPLEIDFSASVGCLVNDDIYIYVAGFNSDKVSQYWKSNMTLKAETTEYTGQIFSLIDDATYVYAGEHNAAEGYSVVSQFWKENITLKAQSPEYGGNIYALTNDDSYVYAGGETGSVCQYWKSNMTLKVQGGPDYSTILALDNDANYIYVGGATQKVYKYLKSDISKVAESEDYTGTITALTYSPSANPIWSNIETSPTSFISNLAYDASQPFCLKVFMPTSSSTNTNQTTTITFTATAD